MGEYIKLYGKEFKLGTCENLYYVRLEDLKQMVGNTETMSGNLDLSDYLDPAHGFRYRFPFPEEDGTQPGEYKEYEHGLIVQLSQALAPSLWETLTNEFEHRDICHSCSYHGTYNVNVMFPCPLSKTPPAQMSTNGVTKAVVITQQKQVDGEIWVIVDCPYCGCKVRLPKEEAEELAACLRTYKPTEPEDGYYHEVANRVLAGYH